MRQMQNGPTRTSRRDDKREGAPDLKTDAASIPTSVPPIDLAFHTTSEVLDVIQILYYDFVPR